MLVSGCSSPRRGGGPRGPASEPALAGQVALVAERPRRGCSCSRACPGAPRPVRGATSSTRLLQLAGAGQVALGLERHGEVVHGVRVSGCSSPSTRRRTSSTCSCSAARRAGRPGAERPGEVVHGVRCPGAPRPAPGGCASSTCSCSCRARREVALGASVTARLFMRVRVSGCSSPSTRRLTPAPAPGARARRPGRPGPGASRRGCSWR